MSRSWIARSCCCGAECLTLVALFQALTSQETDDFEPQIGMFLVAPLTKSFVHGNGK